MNLDKIDTILFVLSISALLYVVISTYIENSQPPIIHRLRSDLTKIRNSLIGRTDLDPDIKTILNRFNTNYVYSSSTTYTKNKRSIHVCVKFDANYSDQDNYNVILFTVLHEVGHVMTPERGHPPNFWQNFTVLLNLAQEMGLYTDVLPILRSNNYKHCALKLNEQYHP